MEIDVLRKKLHILIDATSDEKLQQAYDLLQEDEYTDEFKAELEEEYSDYKKNDAVISREAIDELVEQLMRKQ